MKQSNLTKWLATDQRDRIVLIVITLAAFLLRVWRLESTPPGWRDDELINSLVISQKALDGQWSVFYPDASGHEALYHLLNAAMLTLFGPGAAGIRLLSAILGTLTVPLTYLVADRLFGKRVAVLAAAGLAFSFWSLMYSRIGIRHISLPVFMLGAFFYFLRGLGIKWRSVDKDWLNHSGNGNHRLTDFSSAGIFLGLGFYTYFASRGLPLLMLVFCIYIWLFHRPLLKGRVRGLLLMLGLAALIATPLVNTLAQQPESETRVEELAIPLVEARAGNFAPLGEHISGTLNMFHLSGDGEWLYNIPGRPVFGPVGAAVFWLGVFAALFYSSKPMLRKMIHVTGRSTVPRWLAQTTHLEVASAFTLIWWLGGLSPGFVSVPPASLGHTIIAQSVTYILMGYPLLIADRIGKQLNIHPNSNQRRRLML